MVVSAEPYPRTFSTPSPYRSSFAGPTPLMRRRAAVDVGRCSAMSWSVASVKTTKAGTLSSSARSLRQTRSRSNSSSSYDAGQSPHRPRFFSGAVESGRPHSRQWAARRGFGLAPAALLRISGVGPAKLERYGDGLLEVVG